MTTLGFVALARPNYDVTLADQMREQARLLLSDAGYQLIGPDALVMTMEGIDHTIRLMSIVRPEVLVVLQASFADSTLLLTLMESMQIPVLLWAVPEAPTSGRLRLNGFGGLNLATHSLKRAGAYYDHLYAPINDPHVLEKVRTVVKIATVCRQLYGTRIGRVGDNLPGYTNALVNYEELQMHFGISIEQIALGEVFDEARSADPKLVAIIAEQVRRDVVGLELLDQRAAYSTLSVYVALRKLIDRHSVAALAIRTTPEFFTDLNCSAGGALSMLNNEYFPCSADADVNGAITQLILQWISGKAASGVEIVGFDHANNTTTLWHSGHAPLSMTDPLTRPRAAVHPQRQLPLLLEFALKPGRVTMARLSETPGGFRLVIGTGEMLQTPLDMSGAIGTLRFDTGSEVALSTLLREGLEPQLAITYGDQTEVLLALANLLRLDVLRL